ncbi:hypothetical protein TWF106_010297 [Orbilia oligospora]|uniref:Uncharacterized protein n=2 Tax=Orbilia oligospora TaxID=2813651 RepID=A0A6G1MM33_ORBOL|nr:hypothetical protein TWF106_010297 [Orbilia oligospora]KAF3217289.1 hypothetical protein TWF679_002305 [Orbilia oligospora]KAF3231884.1 hypothetical protein TWF191_003860 [Orbilia oligospora]KAF3263500.1 hypothetical protein TWF192_005781 [Orbilia oligospora]
MKRQSRKKHGRSGSSSSSGRAIQLSSIRPESIPTSVLHRSDIDYSSLQSHLALQDTEMRSVRLVLENIIELNPDFSSLNLRLTSERELLCRIANQHMELFNAGLTRRLIDRDRETDAVGWLLYQFVLLCLKENQRAASRSGSARERSTSQSNSGRSTASISDPEPLAVNEYEDDDNYGDDELLSDDNESPDADDEDETQEDVEDEAEQEQQLRGEGFEISIQVPQHMVDSSDLERELEDYEENIEPRMILRYGSPEVQQQYLQRQGNGHGGIAMPDFGPHSSDEESFVEPKTEASRCRVLFLATCFLILFLVVLVLCYVQYMHEQQLPVRLWDSLILNRRETIATATDTAMTSVNESPTPVKLILTKATAKIVNKIDL